MTKNKSSGNKPGYGGEEPRQNSQYDKIWRENMKAALPGIIEKVIGIEIVHSRDLPGKIQVTQQKEVDFLRKVTDKRGDTFILHIEVQTRSEPKMAYRMLEYRVMAEQIYILPVRQYVIYLGDSASTMPVSIESPDLRYSYTLITLRSIPYQLFLSSKHPEEKILAVLGDFGEEDPQEVLQAVVSEVTKSSQSDFAENQYLQQLRIIIQLRNLVKEFNKIMETVTKFFREENDPFFIKGEVKGRKEGKLEGKTEGKTEVVRNLLLTGRFTISEIADFVDVEIAFVEEIRASLAGGG